MSGHLRNFSRKGRDVFNFACPKCEPITKKRGGHCYAFPADGNLRVYCHRCGWSVPFGMFLRDLNEEMYREYLLEKFGESERRPSLARQIEAAAEVASRAAAPRADPLSGIDHVPSLPPDHPAPSLLRRRKIPLDTWRFFYHADDYYAWARRLSPDTYGATSRVEPRLIIPVLGDEGLVGFQGRSYSDEGVRYLTVSLDHEKPFLYGWERADRGSRMVAVEGPIDSLFLRNGIATAGGSIEKEVVKTGLPRDRFVVAYDNEPRSPTTARKMYRAARAGFPIFVWPEDVREKDFNDWFSSLAERMDETDAADFVMETISSRTFDGLRAELEIQSWVKCKP